MRKQPRLTHHVLVSSSASESYAVEKLQNLNGELAPGADAVAERGRGDRALVVRTKQAPEGIVLDPIQVPAGSKSATLAIKAGPGVSHAVVVLEAVNPDGRSVGESVPFIVEVKPESTTRK